MKRPVQVELTWTEAMNLAFAADKCDTVGWTNASRGALRRALAKMAHAIAHSNPNVGDNDVFLVVRGQTVVRHEQAAAPPVPPYAVRKQLRDATLAVGRRRRGGRP